MWHQGRGVFALVVFFIMVLSSGCTSFRTGGMPEITGWPPAPATSEYASKVILINARAELTVNGNPQRARDQLMGMVRDSSTDAYVGSGLFRLPDSRRDYQLDYIIEVTLKDEETVNSMDMFLSAITLFIREGRVTDRYTLTTTIKDGKGYVLARFEKSDTLVYKQRIGYIFSVFTRLPDVVAKESIYDMNRAIIQEALSQGVFK